MISIQNISKSFISESGTTINVMTDLSLEIPRGEFVTVLGPTGCGKTTLLNMLAGLTRPDSGSLSLPSGVSFGSNIGFVMQHYTLFPWRNLLKNITFPMKMRGIKAHQRNDRAKELLDMVGLGGFEHSYPHELSGGMRQRAAIAQSLAIEPQLLLMDEPFGALDDLTRRQLQKMLLKLWDRQKMTVVFVTHNIDEAVTLGSRVLVMSRLPGRITADIHVPFDHSQRDKGRCDDIYLEIKRTIEA